MEDLEIILYLSFKGLQKWYILESIIFLLAFSWNLMVIYLSSLLQFISLSLTWTAADINRLYQRKFKSLVSLLGTTVLRLWFSLLGLQFPWRFTGLFFSHRFGLFLFIIYLFFSSRIPNENYFSFTIQLQLVNALVLGCNRQAQEIHNHWRLRDTRQQETDSLTCWFQRLTILIKNIHLALSSRH